MRIRTQIFCLVSCFILLLTGAIVFALVQITRIGNEIEAIAIQDHLPLGAEAVRVTVARLSQHSVLQRAIYYAILTRDGNDQTFELYVSQKKLFSDLGTGVRDALQRSFDIVERHVKSQTATPGFLAARDAITTLQQRQLQYETEGSRLFQQLEAGDIESVVSRLKDFSITGEDEEFLRARSNLLEAVGTITRETSLSSKRVQQRALYVMLAIGLVAFAVSTTLSIILVHSITRPLQLAVDYADQIAQGNKDFEIEGEFHGEIGTLLEAMQNMLEAVRSSEATLRQQAEVLASSESALKEKADELSKSNAELEQFAYVASHDLQEPLRMVGSYTQLLARRYKGKLDENADEIINFAVSGVSKMQTLINDLLNYSRVGRHQKPFAAVSVQELFEDAIEVLGIRIDEAEAKVTAPRELPIAFGDRTQLSQLFRNLIGNAIKFRGEAPPCVIVDWRDLSDMWEFSITDNGIGIDPQYHQRVFEIFKRLHTQDEFPGTGIGLAICKKIVEGHGGKIWIESTLGKGTTFHFTLQKPAQRPVGAQHEPAEAEPQPSVVRSKTFEH